MTGRFSDIAGQTSCPFAADAVFVPAPQWLDTLGFDGNVRRIALHLARSMRDMRWASIDAYVIEAPAPKEGFDIPAAARTLNAILRWLDALNPSHDDCFDQPVDASGWRFRYLGEVLFVLVFASFYPTSHSRYAFGAEELLVVLQPDHAFSRRSDSATGLISGNLRGRIRQLYASAGRPYDLTHTLSSREAHRFLKPLANGDPPVRWWSADADAGLAC